MLTAISSQSRTVVPLRSTSASLRPSQVYKLCELGWIKWNIKFMCVNLFKLALAHSTSQNGTTQNNRNTQKCIFSCPGQLNRWHCQSVTNWVTFDFSVKCISHLDNSSICSDCKIKSLSDWLTHWLTRSPIELSWTAKKLNCRTRPTGLLIASQLGAAASVWQIHSSASLRPAGGPHWQLHCNSTHDNATPLPTTMHNS